MAEILELVDPAGGRTTGASASAIVVGGAGYSGVVVATLVAGWPDAIARTVLVVLTSQDTIIAALAVICRSTDLIGVTRRSAVLVGSWSIVSLLHRKSARIAETGRQWVA